MAKQAYQLVGVDVGVGYTVLPSKGLQEELKGSGGELVIQFAYRPTTLITKGGKPVSDATLRALNSDGKGLSKQYGKKSKSKLDRVKASMDPYVVNDISVIVIV